MCTDHIADSHVSKICWKKSSFFICFLFVCISIIHMMVILCCVSYNKCGRRFWGIIYTHSSSINNFFFFVHREVGEQLDVSGLCTTLLCVGSSEDILYHGMPYCIYDCFPPHAHACWISVAALCVWLLLLCIITHT